MATKRVILITYQPSAGLLDPFFIQSTLAEEGEEKRTSIHIVQHLANSMRGAMGPKRPQRKRSRKRRDDEDDDVFEALEPPPVDLRRSGKVEFVLVEVCEQIRADSVLYLTEQVEDIKATLFRVELSHLAKSMQNLAALHFGLSTVRITGIPMKAGNKRTFPFPPIHFLT